MRHSFIYRQRTVAVALVKHTQGWGWHSDVDGQPIGQGAGASASASEALRVGCTAARAWIDRPGASPVSPSVR